MSITHPDLAKELNPTENGDLTPQDITAGTGKKLWWLCRSCSHEWQSTGAHRSKRGQGCPACSGRVVHSDGRNSMASTHPSLAEDLHPMKNGDLTSEVLIAGTNKKLWWLCSECEHEWSANGNDRVQGNGCPACAGRVVHSDGRNSMENTHPVLSSELHAAKNQGINASDVTAGTDRKLWWLCPDCDHEWLAHGYSRASGSGCPVCANQTLHSDGRNSMATTHPELAKEFHPSKNGNLTPLNIVAGTGKKLWWLCEVCQHEWQKPGSGRVNGRGCPACKNKAIHIDGRNTMAATHPSLAKQFHPTRNGELTPRDVVAGTQKKLWWLCSICENEWSAGGNSRIQGRGCPACSNRSVHIDGRNSMAVTHPEFAVEFHPTKNGELTPRDVVAGTQKKLWWLCSICENEWPAVRHSGKHSCPACSGHAVHSDSRNSMAVTHPHLAKEFHPTKNGDFTPLNIVAGTGENLLWLCQICQHEWGTRGSMRAKKNGTGCPACVNQQVHVDGRNSLATVSPEVASEFHPEKNGEITPENIVAGSEKKVWWLCENCEHEWKITPGNRTGERKSGCPACAPTGFDPSKPGTYYVIEIRNEEGAAILYKGGKTGDIERRLSNHKRRFSKHQRSRDWTLRLIETVDFEIGIGAEKLEGLLLKAVDIRAPSIEDLSSELFLHNPLDYAREMEWVSQRGAQ